MWKAEVLLKLASLQVVDMGYNLLKGNDMYVHINFQRPLATGWPPNMTSKMISDMQCNATLALKWFGSCTYPLKYLCVFIFSSVDCWLYKCNGFL